MNQEIGHANIFNDCISKEFFFNSYFLGALLKIRSVLRNDCFFQFKNNLIAAIFAESLFTFLILNNVSFSFFKNCYFFDCLCRRGFGTGQ